MCNEKKIQLNLAIPEHYRDLLRKIAAERILRNPGELVSGASIATEMLIEELRKIEEERKEV
jgi:hypothetical protein